MKRDERMCSRLTAVVSAAAGACLLLAALPGCVGYGSTRGVDTDTVFDNPNSPSVYEVMAVSARWVAVRYPPGDDWAAAGWTEHLVDEGATATGGAWGTGEPRYAVNFPPGMRRSVYLSAVKQSGPGAAPVAVETNHLPIYHVTRARVRGDEATVDVLRPVMGLGAAPGGGAVYQGMTVHLRGGFKPWHVVAHKVWTIGSLPVPELNYLPAEGEKSGTPEAETPVEDAPSGAESPVDEPVGETGG